MKIFFHKMHGLGNDFIIVNLFQESKIDYQKNAIKWCDRRRGIGADGLVLMGPPENKENDLKMIIYNSDGSEADMCGNAIRCFAKFAYDNGLVKKEKIKVETKAGVMIPELFLKDGLISGIRVNMGRPCFNPKEIPVNMSHEEIIDCKARFGDAYYEINALFLGNPHCVIFTEDLDRFPVEKVGPIIENDLIFPRRVNVEFVKVLNPKEIKMRVWERGAGLTLACGTGASAAAVVCIKKGLTENEVIVHLPGGDLLIEWAKDDMVYMTGPAEYVYSGTIEI